MSSMAPFTRSETHQIGFVVLPTNPFAVPSPTNPLTIIPASYWIRAARALPSPIRRQLFRHARWASMTGVEHSPLHRTHARMLSSLKTTSSKLDAIGFSPSNRQSLILTGSNVLGLHQHPGIEFACKVADATFVPLCWPIMAIQVLLGKPPSTIQIMLCLLQTALLAAFKDWCQDDVNKVGTPNPYFYMKA